MTSSKLRSLLDSLANEEPEFIDGKRVATGTDIFAVILSEIDQKVLPTILELNNGEALMSLSVSGRRLCGIIGQEEPTNAKDAAAEILKFADGAQGAILVGEAVDPDNASDPASRISVDALFDAADRIFVDPSAPPIEQFQQHASDLILASVKAANGEIVESNGPKNLIDPLQEKYTSSIQTFLERRAQECPSLSGPSLVLVPDTFDSAGALAMIAEDSSVFLFVVPDDEIGKVTRHFQQSYL